MTTTNETTTIPAAEVLYPNTASYHWDRFGNNVSFRNIRGGWDNELGVAQGPFGFGMATKLEEGQVREGVSYYIK